MNQDWKECESCGQSLAPGHFGDLCAECDREQSLQAAEEQRERELETALACRCGAWGISQRTGQVYHAADCVCGAG